MTTRTLGGTFSQFRDALTGEILRDSDGRTDTGDDYTVLNQTTDQWGRKWYMVEGPSGQTDIVDHLGTIHRDCLEHEGQTLDEWVKRYADEN
jgi:hypothetical protein